MKAIYYNPTATYLLQPHLQQSTYYDLPTTTYHLPPTTYNLPNPSYFLLLTYLPIYLLLPTLGSTFNFVPTTSLCSTSYFSGLHLFHNLFPTCKCLVLASYFLRNLDYCPLITSSTCCILRSTYYVLCTRYCSLLAALHLMLTTCHLRHDGHPGCPLAQLTRSPLCVTLVNRLHR